jgi:uncharacterized membrane protein required for colicin V production
VADVRTVDWVALAIPALTGLGGLRRGLVGTVLLLAGFSAGAVVGARVAPHLLGGRDAGYASLAALAGAVVGAGVLQTVASLAARVVRGGLRLLPPLRLLDSLGGLAAGAALGLALVWVAAAVLVQVPGHSQIRREVRRSQVVQRLNELAPPRDVLRLRAGFDRVSGRVGF